MSTTAEVTREQAAPCLVCRRRIVWTTALYCRRPDCDTVALLAERRAMRAGGVR